MGRTPCCDKTKVKRGPWSPEEDSTLKNYVHTHGTGGNWIALPHKAGLKRCGKSCRLRWLNYLRPDIKHGGFTDEEDNIILTLYLNIGSRWSVIASHLQGRTDNDVKNYWNTKMKKKLLMAQQRITATSLNVSNSNSAILPKAELANYYENMEYSTSTTASPYRPMAVMKYQEQVSGSNPVSSIPRLMEEELVKENDTTTSTSTSTSTPFTSVSSSQGNTPILSPSFSLENSDYATWSGINIGDADAGELGFLENFNYFQEEISEFGHVTNSNYSSWLANFSGHNSAQ